MTDLQNTPSVVIGAIAIHQDTEGRYSLNDLHKAAGGEQRHRPKYWMELQQTKDLIAELAKPLNLGEGGIPPTERNQPVKTIKGGNPQKQGTYVVRELVYAYAMWISPAFHLKVIRTFDAVATGAVEPPTLNPANFSRLQLIELAMQAEQERLALESKVAEIQPKADALDRIATVSDGSLNITETAKTLQIRPKELFQWLHSHEWIYRRPGGSGWIAYQERLQQGLLEHKVTTVQREDGSEKIVEQVRVTGKGLTKLSALFQEVAA